MLTHPPSEKKESDRQQRPLILTPKSARKAGISAKVSALFPVGDWHLLKPILADLHAGNIPACLVAERGSPDSARAMVAVWRQKRAHVQPARDYTAESGCRLAGPMSATPGMSKSAMAERRRNRLRKGARDEHGN